MLNFPSSPTVGQVYILATRTWVFNGKGWALAPQAAQADIGFVLVDGLILTSTDELPQVVVGDFVQLTYI
jgi:hypothetical protein